VLTKYFINNNTASLVIYNGIEIIANSNYQIDSIDILALSTDIHLTTDLLASSSLTTISESTTKDNNGLWVITSSNILTGQAAIDALANYFSPTIVNQPPSLSGLEFSLVQDIRQLGEHGGTSRKKKWNVRSLNTISYDPYSNVTLIKDDIVLKSGIYKIQVTAPAKDVELHKLRVYNETTSHIEFEGIALKSGENGSVISVTGVVTSNGTDLYEIHHYTEKKRERDGLGDAGNLGNFEIYTVVEITKIGA